MSQDQRRAIRHDVRQPVPVTDTMTGDTVGFVANISETGMLLNAGTALREDALYQLHFRLHDNGGKEYAFNVGSHLLWLSAANTPGQYWAGLHFIAISDEQIESLRRWSASMANKAG
ncbi:pilus assembly protein PilZ [Pseudoxanthomonas kalamensis DSM 18571]|uniref:PilZ domain-containing protein n=1 Tax=Pseudoxanthomonas kalamensis TaxID=289483 RepID=UPI001390B7D8|nr:PilZ domain-containing protein [Pseudoxanthomonas kalamensis]KAF1711413.1 pilus assembly protein PilZ [Pseudoxanthomonas kalamensis DSM 18571]